TVLTLAWWQGERSLRHEVRSWQAATGKATGPPIEGDETTHRFDYNELPLVAFSPDGRTVVMAAGKTAYLWEMNSGKRIGLPMQHEHVIGPLAFSPDGRLVLTGSFDKTARLWSAVTGEPLGTPLEHPEPVGNVGFSPDGQRIITGGGVDWLWQAPTGKKLISHEYEKIGSNYFRVSS